MITQIIFEIEKIENELRCNTSLIQRKRINNRLTELKLKLEKELDQL